jgi:hypothetical protein
MVAYATFNTFSYIVAVSLEETGIPGQNPWHLPIWGPSWSWSYGSWIFNYLCNQCLSPLTLWVRIQLRRGVLDAMLCDKVCLVFSGYSGFLYEERMTGSWLWQTGHIHGDHKSFEVMTSTLFSGFFILKKNVDIKTCVAWLVPLVELELLTRQEQPAPVNGF